MSEEMKLLTALCEALGFEVARVADYDERKQAKNFALVHNDNLRPTDRILKADNSGTLDIDENGFYTSILREPIISYTLTPNTP